MFLTSWFCSSLTGQILPYNFVKQKHLKSWRFSSLCFFHKNYSPVVSACSRQTQVWSKARHFLGYTIKPQLHFWLFLLSQRDLTNHFLRTRHWWGKLGRSVYVSGIHHAIGSIWVFVYLSVSWFISDWICFSYVLNPFPGPLYLRLGG